MLSNTSRSTKSHHCYWHCHVPVLSHLSNLRGVLSFDRRTHPGGAKGWNPIRSDDKWGHEVHRNFSPCCNTLVGTGGSGRP